MASSQLPATSTCSLRSTALASWLLICCQDDKYTFPVPWAFANAVAAAGSASFRFSA